jgi:hypothetical protein
MANSLLAIIESAFDIDKEFAFGGFFYGSLADSAYSFCEIRPVEIGADHVKISLCIEVDAGATPGGKVVGIDIAVDAEILAEVSGGNL